APSNELSKAYKVARLARWVVGESAADEEGQPTFKVLGQAPAIASANQIVILVRKGKENADGFDVIAIDGRVNAFGGGKFLFVNAAQVDIAGRVGEEKFVVLPGAHQMIKPKVDGGKRSAHAMFYFRKEKEARPFFSSRWPVGGKARSMIFLYHDPATKRLRMHTIRDFLP
ncbi:MAG: hypothetical protein KJO79_03075, partial [Verrucomicrobiae bacterium]|nr:hypothetical protein [Verrucomicrobiae bacterium]NNJ86138.1 hypothetical protein [Akkermansiaceae bacterium]